ncbi:MAG: hypothetical protein RLZZ165_1270 [Bacteroidota bacterium]
MDDDSSFPSGLPGDSAEIDVHLYKILTVLKRRMKNRYALLIIGMMAVGGVQAQRACGTIDHLRMQIKNDPSIAEAMQKQEAYIQRFMRERRENLRSAATVTIPVVVHVVYRATFENISDAQVNSQIDVLNEDFAALNTDYSMVPSAFQSARSGHTGIQFCLARRDPQGNPTTGIHRVSTTITSFGREGDPVKFTSKGGTDAWPSDQYLNIWVCNLTGGIVGYSQFPGGSPLTDGVVILYSAFGRTGNVPLPYNKGRSATHEVGHWLDLYHIWGDDNNSCSLDDFCNDTPRQAKENFGCPTFPLTDACTPSSPGVMFMNYMDYTDDACMYFFTQQQMGRMNAIMAGTRASLASSPGCIPLQSVDAGIRSIASPSGTSCGGTFTPAVVLKNHGSETLTSVTIHWQVDGGPVSSQAWTGSLGMLASETVILPVLPLTTGGVHTFTAYTANPNGTTDGDAANDSQTSSFRNGSIGQLAPFSYDFSSSTWPPANWQTDNPDGGYTWEYISEVGRNGAGCVLVDNFNYSSAGQKDDFTLPVMDLSNLESANLTFDLAYQLYSLSSSDTLVLLASSDCGTTWSEIYRKAGTNLATMTPKFSTSPFIPVIDTNWRNETVSLDGLVGNRGVWIKFRNITKYQNNLYIDNVNITDIVIAVEDPLPVNAMRVFPNPSSGIFSVEFNLPSANHARLSVFNAVGQQVMVRELTPSTIGKISLDLSAHAAGVYYLRLEAKGRSVVKRLSLQQAGQ